MNKICVYAICKNESKFVKQWVDNMSEADYIVVLDTGSTDDTVELLRADPRVTKVKSQVIDPWRFDVARNESMKLAPKDANILVCTDFDEKFEPGWAAVLRDGWKEDTTRGRYTYAWSHAENGAPGDIFTYDKIHTRDYHWIFPVHEILWPKKWEPDLSAPRAYGKFTEVSVDFGESIYLHHYQDQNKDRKGYFDLLQISAAEHPHDSHVRMLLAREYAIQNNAQEAIDQYLECLKMEDINLPEKRSVLLECLLKVGLLYQTIENYDEAIWYYQEFIKEDPTYREPYIFLGELYTNMTMYTLAEAMVEAGLKYGVQHHSWVEQADVWQGLPDEILGIVKYQLHDLEAAWEHTNRALEFSPSNEELTKNFITITRELNKQRNAEKMQ